MIDIYFQLSIHLSNRKIQNLINLHDLNLIKIMLNQILKSITLYRLEFSSWTFPFRLVTWNIPTSAGGKLAGIVQLTETELPTMAFKSFGPDASLMSKSGECIKLESLILYMIIFIVIQFLCKIFSKFTKFWPLIFKKVKDNLAYAI